MRAFLGKFFWGLVSNDEGDVSTGAVLAIVVVTAWLCHRVVLSAAEVLMLAGGLMAIPKARDILSKRGGGNAPTNGS